MSGYRIGVVLSRDPENKHSWSGTPFYMVRALRKHGVDVRWIGPKTPPPLLRAKVVNRLMKTLGRGTFDYYHSKMFAKSYVRSLRKEYQSEGLVDCILAPAASTEIARMNFECPIVYTSDITLPLVRDYYADYFGIAYWSIRQGEALEAEAIRKSRLSLFPSQWAATSAIRDYMAEPDRVAVLPYGANLDEVPPREQILNKARNKVCKLLFVGVDWVRKGGSIALETLEELRKIGVESHLTVVGCIPPIPASKYANVTVIPVLDKTDPGQYKQLEQLYLAHDFFLLPTRAEAYGIVFCEASAFGLPSLTTATGGVSGVIRHGINGYLCDVQSGGIEYARIIADVFLDRRKYESLMISSRDEYDHRLNWDVWAESLIAMAERQSILNSGISDRINQSGGAVR